MDTTTQPVAENQSLPVANQEVATPEVTTEAGSQVETPVDSGTQIPIDTIRHRSKIDTIRELREDRRQLKAELDSLKKTQNTGVQPTQSSSGFWDNPDQSIKETIRREIEEARRIDKEERQQEIERERTATDTREAVNMIQTQQDIRNNPQAENEIIDIIEEQGMQEWLRTNPKAALATAANLWRQSKGMGKNTATAKAQMGSIRSAATPSGKRIYTRSELEGLRDKRGVFPSGMKEEILLAQKEGRIRY